MCLWSQVPRSVLDLSQAPRSFQSPQIESPCPDHLGPTTKPMTPHLCETYPSAAWLLTAPRSCCWGRSAAESSACRPLARPQWHSHHSKGCSLGAEQSGPQCPHPQTERAPEHTAEMWSKHQLSEEIQGLTAPSLWACTQVPRTKVPGSDNPKRSAILIKVLSLGLWRDLKRLNLPPWKPTELIKYPPKHQWNVVGSPQEKYCFSTVVLKRTSISRTMKARGNPQGIWKQNQGKSNHSKSGKISTFPQCFLLFFPWVF